FSGRFGSSGDIGDSSQLSAGQASFGSASDFMNRSGDVLVYFGSKSDISKINKILPLIDVPVSEALVYGYVFEVQSSEKNGSGLALAAKLLSGKVNIGIGSSQTFDNFIKINTGSLDALYELFKTDSRFHVVSSPRLRVRSGSSASFSVGSDVPVLGQVTYQGERPVQSVEYRSSGVIFNVLPYIRQNSIDIAIRQELSNFVKTDTGVNNSPTLIKRGVTTDVSVSDGDIILLGGLAETKDSDAETGFSFLPGFLSSSSTEKTKSDIVVILQVKKVSG
uniref:type II secretion system protein GspD n=1 Tax=Citrobacter sp. S-77 TaxID=1080067 RepID=UPI0005EE2091